MLKVEVGGNLQPAIDDEKEPDGAAAPSLRAAEPFYLFGTAAAASLEDQADHAGEVEREEKGNGEQAKDLVTCHEALRLGKCQFR